MLVAIGISHSPSSVFRFPCKIILSFLIIFMFSFVNIILQLSSHNCPRDMSDELLRSVSTVVVSVCFDRCLFSIGNCPMCDDVNSELSGKINFTCVDG